MKNTCCVWCHAIISVDDDFNDLQNKGVCSQSCKDAEYLFCLHFSNKEINRRAVWEQIKEEQRAKKKAKGKT